MEQLKITVSLIIAILLQWTLRNVSESFAYIDFPIIIITYAALQRNSINAILYGTIAGIAVDALSGGLLGANGFSKTLVAYIVCELARRVYLENLLLRIPIIAGACLVDDLVFFGMQRMFGQPPSAPFVETIAYSLIGTMIAGTIIFIVLESFFNERLNKQKRDFFASKRESRRRNPIRLGRRG